MTRRRPRHWLLDRTQWWRLQTARLWRSGHINPEDDASICAYAVLHLPPTTRDAFLLNRVAGMSYPDIAAHLSVSPAVVERHITEALLEIADTLDLVKHASAPRGRRRSRAG